MNQQYTDIYILVAGIALFLIELLLLKIQKKETVSLHQTVLNLGLGMIERLIGIITINFGVYFFSLLIPFRILDPIENRWISFIVALLAVDLMWYVYHRISHRISLIWAAHLIHHQSEEYNFSVNFAISPFGFFIRIFVYSSLILFGISPEDIILANAINAFYQYLLHSELWPQFKGWEKIVVTPRFHQIHHSSAHDHLDTNYGGMFTIWDRLFGTYHFDEKSIKYGLTKPLNQQDPFHMQFIFFAKLIENFKKHSFRKAFKLLFVGPENQTVEMPIIYNIPIKHNIFRIIFGFIIFIVGYISISLKTIPIWISFIIGMTGIFLCSGIVFFLSNNYKKSHIKNKLTNTL